MNARRQYKRAWEYARFKRVIGTLSDRIDYAGATGEPFGSMSEENLLLNSLCEELDEKFPPKEMLVNMLTTIAAQHLNARELAKYPRWSALQIEIYLYQQRKKV